MDQRGSSTLLQVITTADDQHIMTLGLALKETTIPPGALGTRRLDPRAMVLASMLSANRVPQPWSLPVPNDVNLVAPDGNPNAAGITVLTHFYFGKPGFAFPGLQDAAVFPSASEHYWDWDADGFGNRRIATNLLFTPAVNPIGDIDLGADEVGDIVISGYLNSSRIFSQTPMIGGGSIQLTQPAIDHFYFGAAGTNFPSRPKFTSLAGDVGQWYQHVESFGLAATDKSWTHWGGGRWWASRYWFDAVPGVDKRSLCAAIPDSVGPPCADRGWKQPRPAEEPVL